MVLCINVVGHERDSGNNVVDLGKPKDCTDNITKNKNRVTVLVLGDQYRPITQSQVQPDSP